MTDATAAPAPAKTSLWEDFIDILYQPSAVFERRRDGKFGMALLALVVLMGVLSVALHNGLAPMMDAEMAKAAAAMAAKNPQITAEQIAAQQGFMEKFAMFGAVIAVPIGVVIMAAILWLAAKVIDAKVAFAASMMIVTYSFFPRVIEVLLNAVQGLLLPPESITSRYSVQIGPARFLDSADANPVLQTVLGSLDLFTIWSTVLLAIGVAVVARVPRARAAVAAVAVWVVTLLLPLYQALSQS